MDPLANQLNELALANSDGLLNDDEYRLLRRNLFERYSGVDIVSVSPTPAIKSPRWKHVELVDHPPLRAQVTPTRSKMSELASFLLRRATGRKPTPPSPNIIKLSMPRMFSKKHEDTSSSDTESSSATRTSHGSRKTDSSKASGSLLPTSPSKPISSPIRANFDLAPPTSPSRSAFPAAPPPSKYDVVPGGSGDIFDDDNLHTSEAIRKAITLVEAEGRRLVTAFNDLETSAVIRYRREHPQRSGSTSNTTPQRPPISLPSNVNKHTKNRSRSNSQRNTDGQSIRSSSSLRTTKSTASLFQSASTPPPAFSQSTPPAASSSPWGTRLSSLRRKGSVSSLSSQPSSFLSVGRAAGSSGLSRSSSSVSRSTSHLPLPVPSPSTSSGASTMMELLNSPAPEQGGEELAEVRRRRAEMVGRCEARLEYLRVKLKTAELHEKLLRK
ncbi:hypothetical protein C8F01DRAFT_656509 [Mycena amicta]|nr:hypothetical protein C8F01DRAFT_656509 [Mycena amicta]